MARATRDDRDDRQATGERRHGRVGLRRLLGWTLLLPLASRAPQYGRLIWELIRDPRTPMGRKALLAAALGYLVVGRDLVPDDVPILGGIDDLVVVVLAVDVFLDGVPAEVVDDKLDQLGIERRTFYEDVASIRRFTPAPLRRMMRRAPAAIGLAADTLHRTRLGPRVRTWINKEGSVA